MGIIWKESRGLFFCNHNVRFQSKELRVNFQTTSHPTLFLLCCWNLALIKHNRQVAEVKIPFIFTIGQLICNNNVWCKRHEIKKKLSPRSVCFKLILKNIFLLSDAQWRTTLLIIMKSNHRSWRQSNNQRNHCYYGNAYCVESTP